MMANLRKCTRCKSTIDISYFGINRKKEPYKTCDNCRNKSKKTSRATPLSDSENTSTTAETQSTTDEKILLLWTLKQQD